MSPRTMLRSKLHSLFASQEEINADEERHTAAAHAGCMAVSSLPERHRGKAAGLLRSVVLRPREKVPTVEAELYDGSGTIDLVWLGRRKIAGIEPGRRVVVEGLVCVIDGRKVMYNPKYQLLPRPGD